MKARLQNLLWAGLAAAAFAGVSQGAGLNFDLVVSPGPGSHEGNGIAEDAAGNIYVTGQHRANTLVEGQPVAVLGGQDHPTFGQTDYFLMKYDPAGIPQWVKTAGAADFDFGTGVIVTPDGDLIVTGRIGGEEFHGQPLAVGGPFDAFVARYSADGELRWIRTGGGDGWTNFLNQLTDYDYASAATLDEAGNIYVVGRVYGAATFGSSTIGGAGQHSCFLARYSGDGQLAWAKKLFGSSELGGATIAQRAGKLFVTGTINDTVDGSSRRGVFTARYDLDGNREWLATHEAKSSDGGSGIALDSSGNIYVAGTFSSASFAFGETLLDNPGNQLRGFVGKYSPDGEPQWVRRVGGRSYAVTVAPGDRITAVGFYLANSADIAGETVPTLGSQEAYMVQFNPAGGVETLSPLASDSGDLLRAVTADVQGRIYITGEARGPAFGLGNLDGVVVVARSGAAVPTGPRLSLGLSDGALVISWNADATGYALEAATTLGGPFNPEIPGLEPVAGQGNTFRLPLPGTALFLRLTGP